MTVGRFASFQTLAKDLISDFGERSTHVRTIDVDDPAQEWRSLSPQVTSTVVDAVWLEYDQERIDGDVIRTGDVEVFIPSSDIVSIDPTTDVLVRVDGQRWQIVGARTEKPNEDAIVHVVQARLQ